ncbi:MAG: hypothetical protein WC587_00065 [Candidatus Paceibacterota bacterium]
MENKEILESISNRLSVLIALQFRSLVEKPSFADSVELLTRFGLSSGEMAEIIGTTKGTVNVTKSRIKNKKK